MTGGSLLHLGLRIVLAFLPVCLFLLSLLVLDSYKLVKLRTVVAVTFVGGLSAIASYGVNLFMLESLEMPRELVSRIAAPVVEELLKGALLIALMRARRIGFLVDAAIQGFAIGAGFALVENLYYLAVLPESSIVIWLIRGFGTAIMHGGTTAIFAIISKGLTQRLDRPKLRSFVPGLLLASALHSLFNHFVLSPLLSTLVVVLALPYLMVYFFQRSERRLQNWLGTGFDLDNEVLRLIHSGEFTRSPIGLYLKSLRQFYPGEVLADMLCYLRLHTELSLRAKGILMMRESGFDVPPDAAIRESLSELRHLRETIGTTAMSSLMPLLRGSEQDLWQLKILEE